MFGGTTICLECKKTHHDICMTQCNTCDACAPHVRDRDNVIPVCPTCDKFIEKEKGELLGTVCVQCRKLHHVNCVAWEATHAINGTQWNLFQFQEDSKDDSMSCVTEIVCPICPTCCPKDKEGNCSDKDRASSLASAAHFMKDFNFSRKGSSSNRSYRSRDCRTSSSTPNRHKILCERELQFCMSTSSSSPMKYACL